MGSIVPENAQVVAPPDTILVTGANGYIAAHVVAQLLESGYKVIGTVRSAPKRDAVFKTHTSHKNLSVTVVNDITKAENYTMVLPSDVSVAGIAHLAAPFSYSVDDYEKDLMIPAVAGSEAILEVAQNLGVKRVVHTNSFACIYDAAKGPRPGYTYTEKDWSPLSYEDGKKAPNAPTAYRAAKAVAEKVAFEHMSKQARSFDLVSLCPAMVFGPYVNEEAAPRKANHIGESVKIVYDVIKAGKDSAVPPTKGPVWVDVRDVARAHVLALQEPSASGQRYMLAAGVYCNQEIADTVSSLGLDAQELPVGVPGQRDAEKHFAVDGSRVQKDLGLRYTTLEASMKDLVPQLLKL